MGSLRRQISNENARKRIGLLETCSTRTGRNTLLAISLYNQPYLVDCSFLYRSRGLNNSRSTFFFDADYVARKITFIRHAYGHSSVSYLALGELGTARGVVVGVGSNVFSLT